MGWAIGASHRPICSLEQIALRFVRPTVNAVTQWYSQFSWLSLYGKVPRPVLYVQRLEDRNADNQQPMNSDPHRDVGTRSRTIV